MQGTPNKKGNVPHLKHHQFTKNRIPHYKQPQQLHRKVKGKSKKGFPFFGGY